MKRIFIIILALIISLTAAAQSIDSKDDLPVVGRQQFFTFITSSGEAGSENKMNQKLVNISKKMGGDAVMLVSSIKLYDLNNSVPDFYDKNNYNITKGIIVAIDYEEGLFLAQCFGSLKDKTDWASERISEAFKDTTLVTKGQTWNYIIDSIIGNQKLLIFLINERHRLLFAGFGLFSGLIHRHAALFPCHNLV